MRVTVVRVAFGCQINFLNCIFILLPAPDIVFNEGFFGQNPLGVQEITLVNRVILSFTAINLPLISTDRWINNGDAVCLHLICSQLSCLYILH